MADGRCTPVFEIKYFPKKVGELKDNSGSTLGLQCCSNTTFAALKNVQVVSWAFDVTAETTALSPRQLVLT